MLVSCAKFIKKFDFFIFRAIVEIPDYVRVARSPQVVGVVMQASTISLNANSTELFKKELFSFIRLKTFNSNDLNLPTIYKILMTFI